MPTRIQLAQRLRVLRFSARKLAIIALFPSPARGGGQGGGFRQLKKDILQRLLRDTQLTHVDSVRDKPAVDRRRLRWIDGQGECLPLDADPLRLDDRLDQAPSLVQRGRAD